MVQTIFCVKDLLTFYLAQPTPPNTEERENADLGEGRGFKDITKFAKVLICIFVLLYFCINLNADLGEGRGFKDITRIAKAVHNFSFQS